MGQVHLGEDKRITREKIRELDRVMNEHSRAWYNMWNTGKDHSRKNRIQSSKVSQSENRAKLNLAYKDHKKEPEKTRPIGTANSSNTRAFANSVSDLLESVANSEESNFEAISSEDMIHSTKVHNKIIAEKERTMIEKERCTRCRLWRTRCHKHIDGNKVQEDENNAEALVEQIIEEIIGDMFSEVQQEDNSKSEKKAEAQITEIIEEMLEDTIQITQIENKIEHRDCKECDALIVQKREEECEECGVQREEGELALVGMDAVALFPSLTSRRTARIVRERIEESKIKLEGFNWKKGLIYILINKEIPSKIPTEVRKYIPFRKSNRGVQPGMTSKGMTDKEGSEERQWIFHKQNPGEELIRKIVSIVAEIAVRILWEIYANDFGGHTYLQSTGGPIGQRPTMAASRLIMTDFFLKYRNILVEAGLEVTLLKVYVDDGRQITSLLRPGMRYEKEER